MKRKRPYYEKVDALFSKVIRLRGECEIARSCKGNLQCCHGFSRSYWATRFDERNAFAGCASCHLWFTLHPEEWTDWLKARWGEDLYWEIREVAMNGRRPSREQLEELAAGFRVRLKEAA